MCGILGLIEFESPVEPNSFRMMLDTLSARGPDSSGIERLANQRVALGHRRLSIIDLSEMGHQPMTNEDRNVWLTFNGEIYNYPQLRQELIALGHQFASQTDSEVIVHGYEQWGTSVVEHLRGIFAFGIWDERQQQLFLARDHLGVKPLYYWRDAERLAFASQPRAFLKHPHFSPRIDQLALQQFLKQRFIPGDRSIYSDVWKLPPAHCLLWNNQQIKVWKYWQIQYDPVINDENEAIQLVQQKLEETIQLQLASDVPVGVLLSGGIDSTSIASISARLSGQKFHCFTMGFTEAAYDEREYARIAVADIQGIPHECEMSVTSFLSRITDHAALYDEPFFDYSGMFVGQLAELARKHNVPVLLGGDGGDEVFAGYRWYDNPFGFRKRNFWQHLLPERIRYSPQRVLSTYIHRMSFFDARSQQKLLANYLPFDDKAQFRDCFISGVPAVTAMQLLDFQTFLPEDILIKIDHASMAHGIEARVPLLDHQLVQLSFQIDNTILMKGLERKALLKQAVKPYVSPALLTMRKKGFGAPLKVWGSQGLHNFATEQLTDGYLVQSNICRPEGIRGILQHSSMDHVWLLLSLELWARHWLKL